jgi:hypothetical protein
MRYSDLKFECHGHLPAREADLLCGRQTGDGDVLIERAIAEFPNGHVLSILRGMKSAGVLVDFETCRVSVCMDPVKQASEADVQREMDRVAAQPPARAVTD